jgi:membrane-bound lytic murein transglycosylase
MTTGTVSVRELCMKEIRKWTERQPSHARTFMSVRPNFDWAKLTDEQFVEEFAIFMLRMGISR